MGMYVNVGVACIHIGFSESELKGASELMGLSCVKGTWKQYEKPWGQWTEYIGAVEGFGKGDIYLNGLCDQDKLIRLVLFMKHLFDKGMRRPAISKVMSAMSSVFERHLVDTRVFSSKLLTRAKKGTMGTNEELAEVNRLKIKNPTLPMCLDMVLECRKLFWIEGIWDRKGLDDKAVWLVVALGFNFGARICHLTLAPKSKDGEQIKTDHALRTGDIKFYVGKEIGKQKVFKGGEELRRFLGKDFMRKIKEVEFAELSFLTSKTVRTVVTNIVDVKNIGRNTKEEVQLLDDLCLWIVMAKPLAEDPIFTRYHARGKRVDRKVVTAQFINLCIKQLAKCLGLPEKMFSSRSLRSGLASHMKAMNISEEEVNKVGGWAEKSRVATKHYTHREGTTGSLATTMPGRAVWSIREIRHLVTQR